MPSPAPREGRRERQDEDLEGSGIPRDVWSRGGRWTARLVSRGAATLEVDLDVGADFAPDPRFPTTADPRSHTLAVRTVAPTTDERAWQSEEEAKARFAVASLPGEHVAGVDVTPALMRAAYRRPAVGQAFRAFTLDRSVDPGKLVDVGASFRKGRANGETGFEIEHEIQSHQHALDEGAAAENAARTREGRALRPRLLAWITRYGQPFTDDELPSPYASP